MAKPPETAESPIGPVGAALLVSPYPSSQPAVPAEAVVASVPKRFPSEKLAFIDALRGLAALMVVACHVAYIPFPNLPVSPTLLRLINSGKAGVVLFFIISAFTLCLSFELRKSDFTPAQIRDFYLRRLFRILPLFLISIPIAWARDFIVYDYARPLPQALASSMSIFIPNDYNGLVWASWTLGVELLFYLLFPFVFRIRNSLGRALFGLTAAILAYLFTSILIATHAVQAVPLRLKEFHYQALALLDSDIRFSILHNLQFFMLGTVFYYLYRDYVAVGALSRGAGRFLTATGLSSFILFVFFYPRSIETVLYGRNLFIGVSFFLFVLGCSVYQSRLVVNRWIVSLGLISYSLYLLHPPLIALFLPLFLRIYALSIPATISYLLCLLITLAVLFPVSAFAFRYIEKPGMAFGEEFISRL
jgi:peptidoglycan/LPS O-acetylase OafA/YrhL